jgi:hypothetical protein
MGEMLDNVMGPQSKESPVFRVKITLCAVSLRTLALSPPNNEPPPLLARARFGVAHIVDPPPSTLSPPASEFQSEAWSMDSFMKKDPSCMSDDMIRRNWSFCTL